MKLAGAATLALAWLSLGCGEPPVGDCRSNLGGIWITEAGDRFHVTDDGRAVEVFSLEPTRPSESEDPSSARIVKLAREGERLIGFEQRFVSRGPRICRVRAAARAQTCSSSELVLVVAVAGSVAFESCLQQPDAGEKTLTLSRIRALP